MTREEWLGLLSLSAHQQGKEITPEVLEGGETVYNHLAELVAAGLNWHTAVELYADTLERALRGDASLHWCTADEAAELLKPTAHAIAAIGLKARPGVK